MLKTENYTYAFFQLFEDVYVMLRKNIDPQRNETNVFIYVPMTDHSPAGWKKTSPGKFNIVLKAVSELTTMMPITDKSEYGEYFSVPLPDDDGFINDEPVPPLPGYYWTTIKGNENDEPDITLICKDANSNIITAWEIGGDSGIEWGTGWTENIVIHSRINVPHPAKLDSNCINFYRYNDEPIYETKS